MSSPAKNLDSADCAVFGVLTILGYVVGLYFTIGHRRRLKQQVASANGSSGAVVVLDAFLGGRSLPTAALAFSVLASVANGMSVVVFVGHFYAHGFHILWAWVGTPLAAAFTALTLAPLLYERKMTSVFQYLRLRFDNKVGITACVVYFVLSQTLGALGIYSAAIGISTMFTIPLYCSSIAIGLAGTVYTALGGLRSVVWADCVQAVVMLASPLTIIGKVVYDSNRMGVPVRPVSDYNVTEYIFRANLDLTSDENVWSCVVAGLPYMFVRSGFDQMVVQRFLAARTLREAKRIVVAGAASILFFFLLIGVAAVALIVWYRGCDPVLNGSIKSYDQIVPYYVKASLSDVTMLRGLFLAGLLGGSTSTVSSIVNSHAATFYVDVVAPYVNMKERTAVNVMRLLALTSGTVMTLFAMAIPLVGTAATLFVALYGSASGPFAALVLLAVSSPWVNAKGAAWASLLVCGLQLWHAIGRSTSSLPPLPVLTGALDRCPIAANATDELAGAVATANSLLSRRFVYHSGINVGHLSSR